MKLTTNELINIIKPIEYKVNETIEYFDYFRITKLNEDKDFYESSNPIYIPLYISEDKLKEGWYINAVDNRIYINNIIKENKSNVTYIIDEFTKEKLNTECNYILVDDLETTINKLTNYQLNNYQGKTILLTGSVGKTSLAGIIESVIKDNVFRIYSKRITPLNFATNILNYLKESTEYIVMESALFYEFHVEYYAKILKPDIGILLNVMDAHLGVDNMNSRDDLLVSKAKLLLHSKIAITNNLDPLINKLTFDNNIIKLGDRVIGNHHLEQIIKVNKFNKNIIPYINTELTMIQNQITYEVGKLLNIDETQIIDRINNHHPVEMRLIKTNFKNKEIIFDGEVSTVPRLTQLSNHNYKNSILIIRELTVGGENDYDFTPLLEVFNKFNQVYIFNNIVEPKLYYGKNVTKVYNHDFLESINDTTIFYHHGSYFRKKEIPLEDKII